jgi:octaprenyl-diphosphate synthase
VEFIHTATLLHDDVVDGSDPRGKETANIYGNPATVLVGDYLFSRSFELMVEAGTCGCWTSSRASSIIAEGEVDQLTAQRKIETSEEHYLSIIAAKTAALFAAACRIAAVAGRSDAEEQALDDYGRYLGVAFQLVDDAIDYDSEAAEMGKGKGDDFRDGKMTLPVILAYAAGTEEEKQFWRDAIAGFRAEDEDLAEAIAIIARHGTVEATRQRAADYAQKAIDALSIFPRRNAFGVGRSGAVFGGAAVLRGRLASGGQRDTVPLQSRYCHCCALGYRCATLPRRRLYKPLRGLALHCAARKTGLQRAPALPAGGTKRAAGPHFPFPKIHKTQTCVRPAHPRRPPDLLAVLRDPQRGFDRAARCGQDDKRGARLDPRGVVRWQGHPAVPRRVAARAAAERMAEMMGEKAGRRSAT